MKGDLQDLTPTKPKCEAAKGLAGDNLFCIDFSSVSDQVLTTPLPPQLPGWDFEQFAKSCWQIMNGKLAVKNFSAFTGNCGFLMPARSSSDYQKYGSFTLSVVHTVNLNKQNQSALMYLGLDQDAQQLWFNTGTNPRQVSTITVVKSALPNGGTNTYQPLFKITSTLAGGATGWQIESIAVMGNL